MSAKQPRLVPLRPDQLDAAQRRLYDAVLASPRGQGGARRLIQREDGSLTGPFDAWLRSPVLGEHLERVGMALRTRHRAARRRPRDRGVGGGARLVGGLRVVGARPRRATRRRARRRPSRRSVTGAGPRFEDPACQAAHDVAHELVERRRLDSPTLERAREALGERALVEVVTLVGFYQLVSGILESFHPPGPSAELPVVGVPSSAAACGLRSLRSGEHDARRAAPAPGSDP